VNFVGEKNKFQNNHGGNKRKYNDFSNNSGNDNKFKKNKTCYNCGKNGHLKRECRYKKKQKKEDTKVPNSANLTEKETSEIIAMISEMHISMITELHIAESTKSFDWWYDSGATVHVCNNKSKFKNYKEAVDGQEVLMGNSNISKVMGIGTIELHFISGKKLILVNVLHVSEIRKNLVFANLLCKNGVKAVIESDNLILSKQ
jgi:hypothetical protein